MKLPAARALFGTHKLVRVRPAATQDSGGPAAVLRQTQVEPPWHTAETSLADALNTRCVLVPWRNHLISAAAVGSGKMPTRSSASAEMSEAELLSSPEAPDAASGSPAGSSRVAAWSSGCSSPGCSGAGAAASVIAADRSGSAAGPRSLPVQRLQVRPTPGVNRQQALGN